MSAIWSIRALPSSCGQLVGVRDGLRGGAAMLAGQVAGLRDFPDGEERRFVVVDPAAGGNVVHRLHKTSIGIAASRAGEAGSRGREWNGFAFKKTQIAAERSGSTLNRRVKLPRATIPHSEDQDSRGSGCDWDHFTCAQVRWYLPGNWTNAESGDTILSRGKRIWRQAASISAGDGMPSRMSRRKSNRVEVS